MSEVLLTPPGLKTPLRAISLLNRLFISGLGLHKSTTVDPWLTPRDVIETIEVTEGASSLRASRAQIYILFDEMERRNLMQRQIPESLTSPRTVLLTHLGKEALTNTAVQGARYYGMTLHDMFIVPEIVETVAQHTEFLERLVRQVFVAPALANDL